MLPDFFKFYFFSFFSGGSFTGCRELVCPARVDKFKERVNRVTSCFTPKIIKVENILRKNIECVYALCSSILYKRMLGALFRNVLQELYLSLN